MPTSLEEGIRMLLEAVDGLDVARASELCDKVMADFPNRPAATLPGNVAKVLDRLRRKRMFLLMQRVAEAFLRVMPGEPRARRQLIQALIDQGKLMEAEDEVLELIHELPITEKEGREARGLLGRIYKQAYVNARKPSAAAARLERAIKSYQEVYAARPKDDWWHGINVVACLARAERDDRPIQCGIDWKAQATEILNCVANCPADNGDFTWAMATATEACVALGLSGEANDYCERYLGSPYADAFELGSTERQLREVWQLDRRNVPGAEVLQIMQGRIGQLGGSITFSHDSLTPSAITYQAQLGQESTRAVTWLKFLLQRSSSVAKITKEIDPTVGGTGFFVRANEIGPWTDAEYVLVTNRHVVNDEGDMNAIRSRDARVQLTQRALDRFPIERQLFSDAALDVTVCSVRLPAPLIEDALGLPLGRTNDVVPDGARKPRLYVIGHPLGQDLQISLYDNQLIEIARAENRIRYRSPTETGSSGSPVLTEELEVVAVHHATRGELVANQGVLIEAIRTRCSQCRP